MLLEQQLLAETQLPQPVKAAPRNVQPAIDELKADLKELGDYHIFQWSTFYRDRLGIFFASFIDESEGADLRLAAESVRHLLRDHTRDTFHKGYFHVTRFDTDAHAISKSLSGLQRFLDLPLEFYSARLSLELRRHDALALRYLTSGMLCGIIEGYSELRFDRISGHQLLSEYRSSWSHILTFMTSEHVEDALEMVTEDSLTEGARAALIPLAQTLDHLAQTATDTDYIPLPALSQFTWSRKRLDISLRPPPYSPRPIEVQCYLDPALVYEDSLTEATTRGVGALIAPLRPALRTFLAQHQEIGRIVVPVLEDLATEDGTSSHLTSILERAISTSRNPSGNWDPRVQFCSRVPAAEPISDTLLSRLPIKRPRPASRTFERRNGVRLWCSVRRSGKTTAGIDLGTTTGESNVISQTCDNTGQLPGGSILYDAVREALASGSQLPNDFFQQTVNSCMTSGYTPDHRTVSVLDEFTKTLFGQLSTAVDHEFAPSLQDLRSRY